MDTSQFKEMHNALIEAKVALELSVERLKAYNSDHAVSVTTEYKALQIVSEALKNNPKRKPFDS